MLHGWREWFILLFEVQYGFETIVSMETTPQVGFDEFYMSRAPELCHPTGHSFPY